MELNLGPVSFRLYQGGQATFAEVAYVTNRHGGAARRESWLNTGFGSTHLTDAIGKDNPADTFECPDTGTLFFGKVVQTPTGVYVISAKEVYTRSIYERACKEGLNNAETATAKVSEPAPQEAEPAAAPAAKTGARKAAV